MSAWKSTYKVIRSILFSAIMVAFGLYASLYIILSIPAVQSSIKGKTEKELSTFLKSKVEIGNLNIKPFNEIKINNLKVYTPEGKVCLTAKTVGSGIRLWKLISTGKIEITYAELVGLDAKISQKSPDSPLNINFIIKAFKPKEKKEPSKFDVKIRNIVIRKSSISFDKLWIPRNGSKLFDPSHICISDLKADVVLPQLKNDDFTIDLRRLAFKERTGLDVDRLSLFCHLTDKLLKVDNLLIKTQNSSIEIPEIKLEYSSMKDIKEALYTNDMDLKVSGDVNLQDFSSFSEMLGRLQGNYNLELNVKGNLNRIDITELKLSDTAKSINLDVEGSVSSITDMSDLAVNFSNLSLKWNRGFINSLIKSNIFRNQNLERYLDLMGDSKLELGGKFSRVSNEANADISLTSDCGNIEGELFALFKGDKPSFDNADLSCDLTAHDLRLGQILEDPKFGVVDVTVGADVSKIGKDVNGNADIHLDRLEYNSNTLENIVISAEKNNKDVVASIVSENDILNLTFTGEAILDGVESTLNANLDVANISLLPLGLIKSDKGNASGSGRLAISLKGNDIDNLTGGVNLHDLKFKFPNGKNLDVDFMSVESEVRDSVKEYTLNSDYVNGKLTGDFKFGHLVNIVKGIVAKSFPSIGEPYYPKTYRDKAEYAFTVKAENRLSEFLGLPLRPGVDINISGMLDATEGQGKINLSAPYLVQGKNKLVKNTLMEVNLDSKKGLSALLKSDFPMKNDRADLDILITSFNDNIYSNISWNFQQNKTATGKIKVSSHIDKNPISGKLEMYADVIPTSFHLNGADWQIGSSQIYYSDKYAKVDNLKVWHGNQYLNIHGVASGKSEDVITVALSDINLNYIFETLNINYVTFGGDATGILTASSVFTPAPELKTESLFVKNLSYNNTVLGDGNLRSYFDNKEKMVYIGADIEKGKGSGAKVDGGIYVTRDSLSLDIEANKVDLKLLKPFVEGFTSDVGGIGSGKMKLFGTFSDIDLVGGAFADSLSMKVDYTNVYYHASDSVRFEPGVIVIPPLKVYDKYGNSAEVEGYVKHRYFHDPEFKFDLKNARRILCYDTSAAMNPDWYGHVFASGSGSLVGWPGVVRLSLNVATDPNSSFTFALNDTQIASEYNFLTFSDRNKVAEEEVEVEESFESRFLKEKKVQQDAVSSLFDLDLVCAITPDARLNLIMDPKAGDKIVAYGNGNMRISYNTDDDEMEIYGKYELAEGSYNFSLQDLILRDFKIKNGSSIAFNGDVMKGVLDIVASYRVNTNLSDIDKSFSTDRDLNRTSVPVDALLLVKGEFTHPDIHFDISLPTMNEEVERKVKSIISTDEMMNRQIIYLLALNRFYTPEYMGNTSNGGAELASVASTTVSSQLSNFLGQLTDKFTLAPSFRSDKGDFSDMEVDVALSSKLLNNRLLINGNFGYRDKATSTTTFIGDFDIEYLLNRNGNLRLKAYNHFNDQDYYLQSAKTTQGIGLIFRRDFDNPFTFLKRRKVKEIKDSTLNK